LALIWGVKKFHHYIYGRKFMLITAITNPWSRSCVHQRGFQQPQQPDCSVMRWSWQRMITTSNTENQLTTPMRMACHIFH
jgi:hypothetical protein